MASDASSGLVVGYWGIRGLAAPIRMMLMHKNVPFRADMYDVTETPEGGMDRSAWFKKKDELRLKNPLIGLPYLMDDELSVSQSSAILAYLGRKLGLWGTTEPEIVQCEALLAEVLDLRNKMTNFVYSTSPTDDVAKAAKNLLDAVQNPSVGPLPKLEAVLAANTTGGGTFLVSDHATAPDFHLWEMLDQYSALSKFFGLGNALASFPHLAAFHTKFAELPANARYLSSPLHTKLPFNNKSGVFGSLPGGGRWTPGTPVDWHGLGGMY